LAPSVLCISGGSSHNRKTGFKFPDRELQTFIAANGQERKEFFVTVEHAESEVYGSQSGCNYRTVARSLLVNLKINNVVTAEEVEAVLESTHPMEPGNGKEKSRIRVRTENRESRIKGLKINGVNVQTERLARLDDYPTFDALNALINPGPKAQSKD